MQQNQWEILILKPTTVFRSFLESQLPEVDLPALKQMQVDNTAYAIRKCDSEEETLDEIERHFTTMFRHEICRWLGEEARSEIEGSFLDFLCCFKFEMHSQIVLMEPSIDKAKQLICIRPRTVLLKWIKNSVKDDSELSTVMEKVDITNLRENSTVVLKNFRELSEIKPFVNRYFKPLFKAETLRMGSDSIEWPNVTSFQDFIKYFAVEIHSNLVHLH